MTKPQVLFLSLLGLLGPALSLSRAALSLWQVAPHTEGEALTVILTEERRSLTRSGQHGRREEEVSVFFSRPTTFTGDARSSTLLALHRRLQLLLGNGTKQRGPASASPAGKLNIISCSFLNNYCTRSFSPLYIFFKDF